MTDADALPKLAGAIEKGMCCRECGTLILLSHPSPGVPRSCHICIALTPKKRAEKSNAPKWTARRRSYNTGRPYWVVMRGTAETLATGNGMESRFPDMAAARMRADELNGQRYD